VWRPYLIGGIVIATLGGVALLVTMAVFAGCSGGYNCAVDPIPTSIAVLLMGLGFLLIVIAFALRSPVSPGGVEPPPYNPMAVPGTYLPPPPPPPA